MPRLIPATIAALALAGVDASAATRSREVPMQFQALHPCPSTGKTWGRCPGYIRDHKMPLCAGGADAPWNMQWQTVHDAHMKDRWEWALCHRRWRQ